MLDLLTTKIVVLALLFIICFACALAPYKFLRFAQQNQNRVQRVIYENIFSLLNCFAAGVFLATCFLDLLPEVRTILDHALALYAIDLKSFPLPEFVAVFGIFLILTIEQTALVFKERFFRRSSHGVRGARPRIGSQSSANATRPKPRTSKTDDRPALPCGPASGPSSTGGLGREKEPLLQPPGLRHQHGLGSPLTAVVTYNSLGISSRGTLPRPLNGDEVNGPPATAITFASDDHDSNFSPSSFTPVPIHPSTSLLHKICDRADHQRPCSASIPDDHDDSDSDNEGVVIHHDSGDGDVVTIVSEARSPLRDSHVVRATPVSPTRHEHVLRDHHHHHPVHHLRADEECGHPKFRLYTLVLSLSIHSVFEGSAVALQPTASSVWALFYALVLHKTVVSFSLGLNLVQSHMRLWPDITACAAIFSSMSPLGIAIGIFIQGSSGGGAGGSPSPAVTLVSGVLQGVACGTFLYVTFFELLPHEMNVAHNRLLKVFALVLGFGLVTAFIIYDCFYSANPLDGPPSDTDPTGYKAKFLKKNFF